MTEGQLKAWRDRQDAKARAERERLRAELNAAVRMAIGKVKYSQAKPWETARYQRNRVRLPRAAFLLIAGLLVIVAGCTGPSIGRHDAPPTPSVYQRMLEEKARQERLDIKPPMPPMPETIVPRRVEAPRKKAVAPRVYLRWENMETSERPVMFVIEENGEVIGETENSFWALRANQSVGIYRVGARWK